MPRPPAAERPPLALIAGPTASGKSALALAVAERVNGVIINADSAQVYADLRVLSARPSPVDEARAPHRLFGHIAANHPYSAAVWANDARAAIATVHECGQVPILVGGTGLYLRTLLDGIAPVPSIDPAIRAEVRALPVAAAHAALGEADPAAAARLNPADTTRIARALEVIRSTGRPLSAWQAARRGGIGTDVALRPLILTPDRASLMEKCDARLVTMFAEGAVDEVSALIARDDVSPTAPVRRAIGVPEIAGWLMGGWDRAEALARAQLSTRRYAKRQYTWFRHQCPADWPHAERGDTASIDRLLGTPAG